MRFECLRVIAGTLLFASAASGAPWIVHDSQGNLDWSDLSLRFYGEANATGGKEAGLKQIDRVAWRNGFEVSAKALDSLVQEQLEASRLLKKSPRLESPALESARSAFFKSVKSLETVYYSSGHVQVAMHADPKTVFRALLLNLGAGSGTGKMATDQAATTLVIEVPGSVKPTFAFSLVDAGGEVLHSPEMVGPEVIKQGTMARWYKGSGPENIKKTVKNQSLKVERINGGARFQVDRSAFLALDSEAREALRTGKVIIVGV